MLLEEQMKVAHAVDERVGLCSFAAAAIAAAAVAVAVAADVAVVVVVAAAAAAVVVVGKSSGDDDDDYSAQLLLLLLSPLLGGLQSSLCLAMTRFESWSLKDNTMTRRDQEYLVL